jgi:hypothetical protein
VSSHPCRGADLVWSPTPGWLAIARTPRATILARLRRARDQPEGWSTPEGCEEPETFRVCNFAKNDRTLV